VFVGSATLATPSPATCVAFDASAGELVDAFGDAGAKSGVVMTADALSVVKLVDGLAPIFTGADEVVVSPGPGAGLNVCGSVVADAGDAAFDAAVPKGGRAPRAQISGAQGMHNWRFVGR